MSTNADLTKDQPDENQQQSASITREDVQTMINGALGTYGKRTEKMITDALAKALAPLQQQQQQQSADEGVGKGQKDSKTAELERQLAQMKKQLDEAERARREEAEARRRTETRAAARAALEAKGVRKELLDLTLDALMANGTIRFEEDGRAVMVVKRSRAKGAAAEEQIFDDLADGVADWVQTETAAALIKAPTPATPNGARPGARPQQAPTIPAPSAASIEDGTAGLAVLDLIRDVTTNQ